MFKYPYIDSPYAETLQEVNNAFDLTCTCGYVTLINMKSKKNVKLRRGLNGVNTEPEIYNEYETNGGGIVLSESLSSNDELLIIKDLEPEKSRSVSSLESSQDPSNCTWLPLQLCYGIPLFDGDLNEEITKKVRKIFTYLVATIKILLVCLRC